MKKPRSLYLHIFLFVLWPLLPAAFTQGQEIIPEGDVQGYILSKIETNDLAFLGTRHRQTPILSMIAELFRYLFRVGTTHFALEIESDQQGAIDKFLTTGTGLEKIRIHQQIDCPEYRNLLVVLKSLSARDRPAIVAIDMPKSMLGGEMRRDEYMAKRLIGIYESIPDAKVLAYLGAHHVFKKLDWQDHVLGKHPAIREYLAAEFPKKKVFSIGQIAKKPLDEGDFYTKYHSTEGPIAVDLDQSFKGWRLGLSAGISIKPAEPYDLLDGLIVY